MKWLRSWYNLEKNSTHNWSGNGVTFMSSCDARFNLTGNQPYQAVKENAEMNTINCAPRYSSTVYRIPRTLLMTSMLCMN